MLKIRIMTVNNFDENTYLLIDEATGKAAVVDPGMLHGEERRRFEDFVKKENINLEQVILTHAHLDHCFGADFVHNAFGVPVKGHLGDAPLLSSVKTQASRFGMGHVFESEPEFNVELRDGDTISIGESTLHVLHVPGHSPGGIALYDKEDGFVIVGDSLFKGSIGRTDLQGGDHAKLLNSIKTKLFTLPDNTLVLPGHGPTTTIGEEKASNPFFR